MVVPAAGQPGTSTESGELTSLPAAAESGDMSVEEALWQRRSVRGYSDEPLTLEEVAQLLWSAQGISDPDQDLRTSPSAGATYPLEVDVLVTGIPELDDGVYRYHREEHGLEMRVSGDRRGELQDAAFGQTAVGDAPVVMVMSGVTARTAERYGPRAERYVHMEAGHAAQNVYLQGTALGIGGVVIGAFRDGSVSAALQLDRSEEPLYLMPLGRPPGQPN
ncbi:MAG: SagB/ThcOx family dehydrogenase [Thioalkalivibrio sp.]|nr:MAG: SagB/ThcOx family dehydrogenase [Thioalkalivibrio sp.]